MNCKLVREQLSAFMDAEMSSATAADVQLHLDTCEGCGKNWHSSSNWENSPEQASSRPSLHLRGMRLSID
ncbi:MAG: zf-HC2 domain-containing protein [Pirellulaceae bacterium]